MLKWSDNLKKWREERKLTSSDWNEYASARTDQANIMAACVFFIGLIVGYLVK